MATLLTDNFNSYANGNLTGNGLWVGDVNFQVQGTTVKEGAKGIQSDVIINDDKLITATAAADVTDGDQYFYVQVSNTSFNSIDTIFQDSTGANLFRMNFRLQKITLQTDVNTDIITNAASGSFYEIHVQWRSSDHTVKAQVNGGTFSSNIAYAGSRTTNPRKITLESFGSGGSVTHYVDTFQETAFVSALVPSVSDTTAITESIGVQTVDIINKSDTTAITELVTVREILQGITPSDTTAITELVTVHELSYVSVSDTTAITESVTANELSYISVSDTTTITDTPTIRTGNIYFDAVSSSPYEASLSTYNWTHVVGTGSSGIVLIGVAIFATGQVSSITVGVKSAVFLRADASGVYRSEIWYVVNPNPGSQTVTVNLSLSVTSIAGAVSYFGVDQDNPFDVNGGTNGVGGSDTLDVTTTNNGDDIISVTANAHTVIAVGTGQKERVNTSGALGSLGIGERHFVSPAATKTSNWTGTGVTDAWAISVTAMTPSVDILNIDTVSDTTPITELITTHLLSYVVASDTSVISELISMQMVYFLSVSDTTIVSESVNMEQVYLISVSDTSAITETITTQLISMIAVQDTSAITELVTMLSFMNIVVSDTTTITEVITSFLPILTINGVSDTSIINEGITMEVIGWIYPQKHTADWVNPSKHTASWNTPSKHTTTWWYGVKDKSNP